MRANAGRPSPLFRRHQLRAMVAALRNARKQFSGQQKRAVAASRRTNGIPFSLKLRRAVAQTRAWVARRFR